MPPRIVVDELHLTVRIPADLPEQVTAVVRQTLLGDAFMVTLKRAVRHAFRAFPEMSGVRFAVTR